MVLAGLLAAGAMAAGRLLTVHAIRIAIDRRQLRSKGAFSE